MVFPIESEDRTLRNLLMLCQDDARLIVEAYRKSLSLFDALVKGKASVNQDQLAEMKKVIEESNRVKESLIKEINDIGGILVSRDDFLRLTSAFSSMMDVIEGITLRLCEVKKRNFRLTKEEIEELSKMSDLTFDTLLKLRDGVVSLGFNSEKVINFAKEIDELERQLDAIYFKVDLDIMASGSDLPAILLLRDVTREVDHLGDKVIEASNLMRILAL
jgi:uncharacterized protein Yka (UPF0111/DUF47 family)